MTPWWLSSRRGGASPFSSSCSAERPPWFFRAWNGEGRDVVIKLAVPDPDLAHQVGTLVRARGRGYARVVSADPDRHAVLLEALGPSLDRSGLPPEDQLRVLCDVLGEAWTALPADGQQPLDKAGQLHELVSRLWQELDQPCPRPVVDRALACAAARSADPPPRWVVVHGDAAAANCLRVPAPRPGAESGYAFVDPDGFLGDPAYDLGVALRNWSAELLTGDAGLEDVGRPLLRSAEALCAAAGRPGPRSRFV